MNKLVCDFIAKFGALEDIKLSYSALKNISNSIEHHLYNKLFPREQSDEMIFGSAFHCFVLEPAEFKKRFMIEPVGINRKTEHGRAKLAALIEQNKGKQIITFAQMQALLDLDHSLKNHPVSRKIFEKQGNVYEEKFEMNWGRQKFTGIYDIINRKKAFIADIKTISNASIENCVKEIIDKKYYIQSTLYLNSISLEENADEYQFYFVFVEKQAPFGVQVVQLDSNWLKLGIKEVDELVNYWLNFVKNPSVYTGYSDEIIELQMPGYTGKKDKNQHGKYEQPIVPERIKHIVEIEREQQEKEHAENCEKPPHLPKQRLTAWLRSKKKRLLNYFIKNIMLVKKKTRGLLPREEISVDHIIFFLF